MNSSICYGLAVLFVVLIGVDLGVFGGRVRARRPADALAWSLAWLAVGVGFAFFIYGFYEFGWQGNDPGAAGRLGGAGAAARFLGAFLTQKLLCVGAMLMTALIFAHLKLSLPAQRRTLFWAVFVSLILRALVAVAGIHTIRSQDWTAYLLGGAVVYSGAALMAATHRNRRPSRNLLVKLAARRSPLKVNSPKADFFQEVRRGKAMTHAFIALLMAQSVAFGFAVSSLPATAVFTRDPFIMASSAACACLGFQSLYFVVAAWLDRLRYFKIALGASIALFGIQFLLSPYFGLPPAATAIWLAGILGAGALASWRHRDAAPLLSPLADDLKELGAISVSQTRRVVILTMGLSMIVLGVLFMLTPLPGWLTVFAGFGLLSVEFVWARRWLKVLRDPAQLLRKVWSNESNAE